VNALKVILSLVLAAIAYITGVVVMGILGPFLHIPAINSVPGMSPQQAFTGMLVAVPILILGLVPLAWGMRGGRLARCFAIAILLYVTLGLNTLLETKIYTQLLAGSPVAASMLWVLPAVLTAAVLAFRSGASSSPSTRGAFWPLSWSWRLITAWLAFPMIYFFFGMCVAPIVVPYYQSHSDVLGLHIPGFHVIIGTQLLRSALFLGASLPAIWLWTKSRGRLVLALGLAHAVTVGIFPLAQANFFPMALRVAHSMEITADSFAYAAVLGLLFIRATKRSAPAAQSAAAD
jgi:hypothetical protein